MIKLSKPYISEDCIDWVTEVLRSGSLVQGKYVDLFEQEVQKYLGVEHALLVSNGTAALHLSLIALGIGPGDEVIVPAFTYPATANVVELVGAKTVLVDITLDDFCIDTSLIEAAITPKTKAIMPVHEFGQAAKMDTLMEVARKYGLYVIEDAACALGAEFDGRKVGTFGNAGCFSLHPRKAITSGEGGIIVTNDDEVAEKIKIYRNHGIAYKNDKMDFVAAGFNYRLTDFQAALCLPQLNMIETLIRNRLESAALYDEGLKNIFQIKIPVSFTDRRMIYQTYHILLNTDIDRNKLILALKSKGIETNYGAQALNTLTYYSRKYGYCADDCPNAVRANTQGLSLPLGMHLNSQDVKNISSTLIQLVIKR